MPSIPTSPVKVPVRFLPDGDRLAGTSADYVVAHLVNADAFAGVRARLESGARVVGAFQAAQHLMRQALAEAQRAAELAPELERLALVAEIERRVREEPWAYAELAPADWLALVSVVQGLDEGRTTFAMAPECAPRPPLARLALRVHDDILTAPDGGQKAAP